MENLSIKDLNLTQRFALKKLLESKENIFLTGAAGAGKSYVIKLFRMINQMNHVQIPIVASTGAASILVNGITFNSFFGLGIMSGGSKATIERALTKRTVCERIVYTDLIVIDEISMLSGEVLQTANELCQMVRGSNKFFGGMRVIVVGDFAQLGPYSETDFIDWAFNHDVWKQGKVKTIQLKEIMRTKDLDFLKFLENVREGKLNSSDKKFLNSRLYKGKEADFEGARIFSRNKDVDACNDRKLHELEGKLVQLKTKFVGEDHFVTHLKKNLVIKETILLKKNALVMLRVNNIKEGYINGTMGHVIDIRGEKLIIKKLDGNIIHVSMHVFEMLDGSGKLVAAAKNFPIVLSWAITIQKAQGASIDKALISLERLWLPGQAYTALSRLKSSQGLHILKWDEKSIFADKDVVKLYKKGLTRQKKEEVIFIKSEVVSEKKPIKKVIKKAVKKKTKKKVSKKKSTKKKLIKKTKTKKKTVKKKYKKKVTRKKVAKKSTKRISKKKVLKKKIVKKKKVVKKKTNNKKISKKNKRK